MQPVYNKQKVEGEEFPEICTLNVGGKRFLFSREAIRDSGDNFLSCAIKKQWKEKIEVFVDVDPKIFKNWIAPYVRHLILPDLKSIKDGQQRQHIVAAADMLGLSIIAEHVRPPPQQRSRPPKFRPHVKR